MARVYITTELNGMIAAVHDNEQKAVDNAKRITEQAWNGTGGIWKVVKKDSLFTVWAYETNQPVTSKREIWSSTEMMTDK